ncbi:MAG TPA: hypothetical protein VGQ35_01010 [Dongiaceae bacterium]|jgi:hypothetical protein|nr:hypothetical protein [Dongiaceae bacterium]
MQRFVHRPSILRAAGAALSLVLLSHAAAAEQPGQNGAPGTPPPAAQSPAVQSPDAVDIFIGELEKRIIGDYYQRHLYEWQQSPEGHEYGKHKNKKNKHKGLPPGLAKKGTLPPGLAKQLARNGHLPPGLDYHPLPQDLVVQLPPLQPAYRYVIVDDRVMLIQAASNLILDVLEVAAIEILN